MQWSKRSHCLTVNQADRKFEKKGGPICRMSTDFQIHRKANNVANLQSRVATKSDTWADLPKFHSKRWSS